MNRKEALLKLQQYNFAAYDMLLYLDTHPCDKKAFEIFKELAKKTQEARKAFEEKFGPLSAFASASGECFDWLNSPWPWEKEANI